MTVADDLAYYRQPGPFTRLDGFDAQSLPDDIPALVKIVQGVLIHRGWLKAYNIEVAPERLPEEGLHSVEAMLARARQLARRFSHAVAADGCSHFAAPGWLVAPRF